MQDHVLRATAAKDQIRAFAISSKNMAEASRKYHQSSPVVSAALGRLLSGASMMGLMMKGDRDVLTIIMKGDGPVNGLTVTANSKGMVKGYPGNPNVDMELNYLGKLDVGGAIGYGTMTVIKDLGLKEPYSSTINLTTSEVAEDLTYYFASSEQTPSAVALGVLVDTDTSIKQAGGFIVQLMPDATEETISKLEKNISKIHSVTDMLEKGMTPKTILEKVLEGLDLEILEKIPDGFECDCSKDKIVNALISVGKEEMDSIINDGKEIDVACHFCCKHYKFSIDELKNIREKM